MKKRSILSKQSVAKKQKRKTGGRIISVIRPATHILFKSFFLLVIVSGVSLTLMFGYHYLQTSSYTKLEKVEVTGVDERIKYELIDMCDLDSYPSLLFLDLKALKQKMEKHPWIRSVKLKRRFPSTLKVWAEKHAPLALVVMDGIYFMNQWCEVFKEVNELDDIDLPVITGVSEHGLKRKRQLHRAAHVIKTLASQKGPLSLKELSEVHVKNKGISLYFSHLDAEINVMSDDFENKICGLRKVRKHLRNTGRIHQVIGIDLNSADGAVVSFRKS